MKHKKVRLLFILIAFFVFCPNSISQLQTKSLPIEVTCRKSLMGGSYVLQIVNTSSSQLEIWLDAREKYATYLIPAGTLKEIGWAQGYRFDANDVFFIGADGYDTLKRTMPNTELSSWRISFTKNGALTINLSQSLLQSLISSNFKLPMKQNSKILDVEINEMPQIILKDKSQKVYSNVVIHATGFSGKVHIPIKATVSFVPSYVPSNGAIMALRLL